MIEKSLEIFLVNRHLSGMFDYINTSILETDSRGSKS